jgi:hypothetical protein
VSDLRRLFPTVFIIVTTLAAHRRFKLIDADSMQTRLLNAFGETVTYTPKDGSATVIKAIRTVHFVDNALDHQGTGPQKVTFDIASLNIPRPAQNDYFTDSAGVNWFLKEVPHMAFEGQWRVTVEKQKK